MSKSFGDVVFETVLEFGCYYVGRAVILIVSLGHWKCDRMEAFVPRRKLRVSGFRYLRGQQVYATREAVHLVGLISAVLSVCCGVMIWYFNGR